MSASVDPKRTIAELRELRALTSDENGAQRVAFTGIWAGAREWLRLKLEEMQLDVHIDSVPTGGWLDGCLNTLAGVEILRHINTRYNGRPPVTVRLVDSEDEES